MTETVYDVASQQTAIFQTTFLSMLHSISGAHLKQYVCVYSNWIYQGLCVIQNREESIWKSICIHGNTLLFCTGKALKAVNVPAVSSNSTQTFVGNHSWHYTPHYAKLTFIILQVRSQTGTDLHAITVQLSFNGDLTAGLIPSSFVLCFQRDGSDCKEFLTGNIQPRVKTFLIIKQPNTYF